ncbi:MAG: hypothetical protein JW748_03995 [Anaerolineales bacterium]|nr:hypothetical protein [Anaerolineales bacterium]
MVTVVANNPVKKDAALFSEANASVPGASVQSGGSLSPEAPAAGILPCLQKFLNRIRQFPKPYENKGIWVDMLLILAVGTLILLLQYEGWRSWELINLDMLPYYSGARDFLAGGPILEKGELSSYNAYNPPGTVYWMIPGMLLTSDARLQTLAGTTLLFFGAVFFLYLAVREVSPRAVAIATALVFVVSHHGLIGLWPVGHPFYITAALYFLLVWIKRRSAGALGAALAVLVFGLYVDLAILPFLFVLPVLWFFFRPPVRWKPLLLAGVFGLFVWFPYLRYESGRGFSDLASLLLLRPVGVVGEKTSSTDIYCYTAMPGENDEFNDVYLPFIGGPEIEQRVVYPLPGWKNAGAYRICRTLLNIDRNFDTDLFALGANWMWNAVMWWIFAIGWSALGWAVLALWRPIRKLVDFGRSHSWVPPALAGAGAIVFYLVLNPDLVSMFAADKALDRNMTLAVEQMRAFVPWIWSAAFLGWFLSVRTTDSKEDHAVLFAAFSLPWLILVILAEPGKPERFWFMWPLQVWIMVIALRWAAQKFRRANWIHAILAVSLGAALLPIPLYSQRISEAGASGYSGSDSDQWRVVEYLAGKAAPGEKRSLHVEYWLADSGSARDAEHPGCRIEDWFNYLLESGFNVHNLASANGGLAPGGAWEVVDRNLPLPAALEGLTPEAVIGHYAVFKIS